jgi:hypothetical protein
MDAQTADRQGTLCTEILDDLVSDPRVIFKWLDSMDCS